MSEKSKYYLNPAQQYIHAIDPNSLTLVAGRRFGKSDGVAAPRALRRVQMMPRGIGFFYAETFKQALSRTLPGTLAALERLGFKEDKHYFVGRKAPDFMRFPKPYISPSDWSHVVHFYNGSIIHILSQDVKFSANSLTTDWGYVDEGRSIKKDKFTSEVVPTLSGSPGKFENCHYKRGYDIITDMMPGKQGVWILDNEKKMDKELLKTIEATILEINRIKIEAGDKPSLHFQRALSHHTRFLNSMRRHLHLYVEYDSIENIEVIGVEYIAQQKRDLPPVTFAVSIMNKRITKNLSGFYPNLDRALHCYKSIDNNYINNLRTERDTLDLKRIAQQNCLHDADIDPSKPLMIAFDFNAAINWVVTGQDHFVEMRTLSSKFTKHSRKLRALLDDWDSYYRYHIAHDVVVYYDSTATKSAYADEQAESFIDIIYNTLVYKGWYVTLVYVGNPIAHDLKHQYIDDAFTGRKYRVPRFNEENNEHLLLAMELTGVKTGRNGFEKNKSGEKLIETQDDLLEYRTDGTDAWDTLFIGMNLFPYTSISEGNLTHYSNS